MNAVSQPDEVRAVYKQHLQRPFTTMFQSAGRPILQMRVCRLNAGHHRTWMVPQPKLSADLQRIPDPHSSTRTLEPHGCRQQAACQAFA